MKKGLVTIVTIAARPKCEALMYVQVSCTDLSIPFWSLLPLSTALSDTFRFETYFHSTNP